LLLVIMISERMAARRDHPARDLLHADIVPEFQLPR